MSESKTPRTDAEELWLLKLGGMDEKRVMTAFDYARQLETELSAMTAERDALKAERDALVKENEWHLASELPDSDRNVLLQFESGMILVESRDLSQENGWGWVGHYDPPIRWRELPQPPKGEPE